MEIIAKVIRTIFFTVFITVLVLIFIPVYIFRFALSLLHTKRRLGPIEGHSSFMAINSTKFVDADGSLPALFNVILKLRLRGRLNLEKLAADLQNKLVSASDSRGKLQYPEMQQYVTMCHGFPMWVADTNFSLQNHLTFCTEKDIQGCEVDTIFKQQLLVPFQANRSPWETFVYYIAPNQDEDEGETLIHFKFHHCLSDGYSIFFAITKMCCEPKVHHKYGGRKTLVKKARAAAGNAGCCYSVNLMEFVSVMKELRTAPPEGNICQGKAASNHKLVVKSGADIKFDWVRAAAKAQNVSCTSIIVTCIANGVRRFTATAASATTTSKGDISPYMIMKLPFPVLQHSMRLRNQLFGGPMKLALDSAVSPSTSEAGISRTKKIAPVLHYVTQVFYALPLKLQSFFTANGVPGVTVSIFPGPTEKVSTVDKNLITEIEYCLAGFSYDPFVFSVLTYDGQLGFWVTINPQYIPPGKEAQDLVRDVESEFVKLLHV